MDVARRRWAGQLEQPEQLRLDDAAQIRAGSLATRDLEQAGSGSDPDVRLEQNPFQVIQCIDSGTAAVRTPTGVKTVYAVHELCGGTPKTGPKPFENAHGSTMSQEGSRSRDLRLPAAAA